MKFEYVFGGVMPSPAGVNASRGKNFDHVGEAEICSVRRGRSQCRWPRTAVAQHRSSYEALMV